MRKETLPLHPCDDLAGLDLKGAGYRKDGSKSGFALSSLKSTDRSAVQTCLVSESFLGKARCFSDLSEYLFEGAMISHHHILGGRCHPDDGQLASFDEILFM